MEDDRLSGGNSVGDVLLLEANNSDSFVVEVEIDKGLRATLPGVIVGSSSIVLIRGPYNIIHVRNGCAESKLIL